MSQLEKFQICIAKHISDTWPEAERIDVIDPSKSYIATP